MNDKMNIYTKLTTLQTELKAPKSQFNKFGKYKYRNCEDILEAVKPLLLKHNLTQLITDEIVIVGERFYVKSTVLLINAEAPEETITVTAFAREEDYKKGMDASQLTGATSSYARKYALSGLYAIDDTKDADSLNNTVPAPKKAVATQNKPTATKVVINPLNKIQLETLKNIANEDKPALTKLFNEFKIKLKPLEQLTEQEAVTLIDAYLKREVGDE